MSAQQGASSRKRAWIVIWALSAFAVICATVAAVSWARYGSPQCLFYRLYVSGLAPPPLNSAGCEVWRSAAGVLLSLGLIVGAVAIVWAIVLFVRGASLSPSTTDVGG